jgi:hypothetical protein
MSLLTYDAITVEHGEEVGLAYEKLVECFIEGNPHMEYVNILVKKTPTAVAEYLIWRADKHAKQEIEEAAKHIPIKQQARCPRCQKAMEWDWAQDQYLIYSTATRFSPALENVINDELTSHSCPYCNKLFAFTVTDDDGAAQYNHDSLKNIDWECELNSHR